jgi:hypothetical protein
METPLAVFTVSLLYSNHKFYDYKKISESQVQSVANEYTPALYPD